MKDNDEKLKDIFKRGIEEAGKDIPDFRTMMDEIIDKPRRRYWLALRIAASILVIVGVGIFLVVNNQGRTTNSGTLTGWNEPTKELMTASSPGRINTISAWSSPTDFLLTNSTHKLKTRGYEKN